MSAKQKFYPPTYGADKFSCSACSVYAIQYWTFLGATGNRNKRASVMGAIAVPPVPLLSRVTAFKGDLPDDYAFSKCSHCSLLSMWYDKKIVFPKKLGVDPPQDDLGEEVKELYVEAANTYPESPRAAAALLRLALQLFLKELGGQGKDINTDIKTIVAKGVSKPVQQALDIIRVFGNNGVHPGQIDLKEDPALVEQMFPLINFVSEKMITQEKEISDLYDKIPDTVKEQISKRDGNE